MSSLDGVPAALPGVRGRQCSPTGTSTLWLPLVVMLGVTLSGPVCGSDGAARGHNRGQNRGQTGRGAMGNRRTPHHRIRTRGLLDLWRGGERSSTTSTLGIRTNDWTNTPSTVRTACAIRAPSRWMPPNTWPANRLHLEGDLVLTRNTSSTWGIGPNTPDSAEEEFMQAGVQPKLALLFEAFPSLSIGPELAFFYSNIFEVDPDGALASGTLAGKGKTFHTGIGLMVSYNSTNKKLYKIQGTKAELRGDASTRPTSALRRPSSRPNWICATTFRCPGGWCLRCNWSCVPIPGTFPSSTWRLWEVSDCCGGYSSERYLGHDFVGTQVELRYPIFWRFGGTAFFGAADVEESLADLGSTVRFAGGMGTAAGTQSQPDDQSAF